MCVEISGGLTQVIAHERSLITNAARHGEYFNKNINEEESDNTETVKVGDPEAVEREPELAKQVEDYDSSQEIIEKRTENTKIFELKDGSRVTKQYFELIHKEVDGQCIDIDDSLNKESSLLRSNTNQFKNNDGIFPVTFNDSNINVAINKYSRHHVEAVSWMHINSTFD